jgi:hypothetical protein
MAFSTVSAHSFYVVHASSRAGNVDRGAWFFFFHIPAARAGKRLAGNPRSLQTYMSVLFAVKQELTMIGESSRDDRMPTSGYVFLVGSSDTESTRDNQSIIFRYLNRE